MADAHIIKVMQVAVSSKGVPLPGYAAGNKSLKRILIAGEAKKTENYEKALGRMGAVPETSLHVPDTSCYDGLLLPGGGDIDPKLFGQLPGATRSFDPALDRVQLTILSDFVQDKKPVLGVCKGMQLINIFFGGDMHQHLAQSSVHEYQGADQVHETVAEEGSFLEKIYGKRFWVNSAHHQGVDVPGQGIQYVQFALDGVVEGLTHKYLPVLGLQWHPERLCFDFSRQGAVNGADALRYFLKML